MAYTKTNWVNGTTPINATNLNHIEDGIKDTEGTVLHNTSTNNNFALSETVANFSYYEVFFHSILGYGGYAKFLSNRLKAGLITTYKNNGNNEDVCCTMTISGTTVTLSDFYVADNGAITDTSNKYLYVDKIVGYK